MWSTTRSRSVTDGDWKFILNFDKGKSNELYSLKGDPEEENNLINEKLHKGMELELRRFVAGLR